MALVLDFDGLILDTEQPLVDAWRKTFEFLGAHPIGADEWADALGRHSDDPATINPLARLEQQLGSDFNEREVQELRRGLRDELLDAQPLCPGVESLLDQADQLHITVGIASSSPTEWIERHLAPRALLTRFAAISCASATVPGKPDPATYVIACEQLGVAPTLAIAFEDSPHGVRAAKAAGMLCVAVPTPLTEHLDFADADAVIPTLNGIDLADLIKAVKTPPGR